MLNTIPAACCTLLIISMAALVGVLAPVSVQSAQAQTYRGTLDDHDEPGSKPSLRKKVVIRYVKKGARYLASVNNSPFFEVPISKTKYGTSPPFRGERGCDQTFYLATDKPGPSRIWVYVAAALDCGSKQYAYGVWGRVRR